MLPRRRGGPPNVGTNQSGLSAPTPPSLIRSSDMSREIFSTWACGKGVRIGTGCPPEADTATTRQPSSKSSEKYTRTPSVAIAPSHFTWPSLVSCTALVILGGGGSILDAHHRASATTAMEAEKKDKADRRSGLTCNAGVPG